MSDTKQAVRTSLDYYTLKVFDLSGLLHAQLAGLSGETFLELDLVESDTNHNHEDIVESIEVYQCVAIKRLQ